MSSVMNLKQKGKKNRVLGKVEPMTVEDYQDLDLDSRVEVIQALIPLGLLFVSEKLESEVEKLAGERYSRVEGDPDIARYGSNRSSVKLGGQRHLVRIPCLRNRQTNSEVPLESWQAMKGTGDVNETLLRRVLYGISCRNYEAASEAVPGAIGLSSSTVSRAFVEASAQQLKAFQERDLSEHDFVVLVLDGKTFAEAKAKVS